MAIASIPRHGRGERIEPVGRRAANALGRGTSAAVEQSGSAASSGTRGEAAARRPAFHDSH